MMVRKVLGVLVSMVGLGVAVLWVVLWLGEDDAGRFECDRAVGRCVVHAEDGPTELPLESIQSAHVSHSRASGHSLVLTTASTRIVLAGHTMDGDSRREYEEAADAIRAFLEGRTASVDVTYTHRVGIAQLLLGVVFGVLMAVAGVVVWRGRERAA